MGPATLLPGESPPPPPRAFFGREELIEEVVGLADNLVPIALVGAGGIGKTAIALTVLHDDRIKRRFGDNRRFIRCDNFPASPPNFLTHLSKAIGARVENPEDLAPLRPFLSSKEMLIVIDNAETILDPQGVSSREMYRIVEELCQLETICLCITSRISTVPPDCELPMIPTLSMEAARDIFYNIYGGSKESGVIDDLLSSLDFHALSITLLATTASDNGWDSDQLAKEWDKQRGQVLRMDFNKSLAATIKLSLASPTFRKLGPNARELLEVVAFFPQGVDEKNLDWLFPSIPNGKNILDQSCALSLAYRRNGFVTMLAPLRDHLCPRDPISSPLLFAAKDRYFTKLSIDPDHARPDSREAQWIKSEDQNIEHLLHVFTSINPGADDAWDACGHFMHHLYWHNPRRTVLGPKIEALPDSHPSKPRSLFRISHLSAMAGNYAEQKRLLACVSTLQRERGEKCWVALTLEMYERFEDTVGQGECSRDLTLLLLYDDQLDAAKDSALRTIDSPPEKGKEYLLCRSHRVLGEIYDSKGEREKAIHHFKTALEIASPFGWQHELFWIHYALALLFSAQGGFDDANIHIVEAKSHAGDVPYKQGRAMNVQAWILYRQRRLEDARSEASGAAEIYRGLGAAWDVGACGELLKVIERAMESQSISGTGGGSLTMMTPPISVNYFPF